MSSVCSAGAAGGFLEESKPFPRPRVGQQIAQAQNAGFGDRPSGQGLGEPLGRETRSGSGADKVAMA